MYVFYAMRTCHYVSSLSIIIVVLKAFVHTYRTKKRHATVEHVFYEYLAL